MQRAASRPPQTAGGIATALTAPRWIPHPSTKLPPRKTARSDALTIEMSALEARPPTAPESWLLSGMSFPPWVRSRHNLTPNITGGIRRRLRTGHRPGTDSLPVGSHRAPSEQPTHNHASAELVPESGRQHRQGEERERGEREREERGEGEGVCTREEWGECLWWVVVLLR